VSRSLWTLFAPVALFSTWAALAHLYSSRSASYVLSLLILIWVADIAAYFAGKAFGKNKLAPRISPGKTLEGAAAGVIGVFIWVLGCALFWPHSFGSALVNKWSWFGAGLLAILLAVVSIAGDLFESLLKRRAGVKDSSQLLPGHGGVYDRIDAVVAVVPLAYLLTEAWSW
jgi:phosphatidate cytidylyltransferase